MLRELAKTWNRLLKLKGTGLEWLSRWIQSDLIHETLTHLALEALGRASLVVCITAVFCEAFVNPVCLFYN